jgi:hypothetical protein
MSDEPEWFAPKRYGYGAGLPISREGWAVTIGYLVLLGAAGFIIPYTWIGYASIVTIITVAFIVIASRTTRGGWRWRWGEED